VIALFAVLPLEHTPALREGLSLLIGLRGAYLAFTHRDASFVRRLWVVIPWLALASASYFWSVAPELTLRHLKHDLWIPLVAMFGCYQLFRHRLGPGALLWGVALGTGINLVITALGSQYAIHDSGIARHYFSTVGYASTYALYFLALALPWLFDPAEKNPRIRLATAVIVVASLAAGIITHNRMFLVATAVLAVAVAFFSLQHSRRRLLWATGLCALLLVTAFLLQRDERVDLWRLWGERVAAAPLLGAGFGRDVPQAALAPALRNSIHTVEGLGTMHSHDLFLNVVLENGVVGLLCFLFMVAQFVVRLARARSPIASPGVALIGAMLLKNATDVLMLFAAATLFYAALGSVLGSLRE
jgi:O-antigen ligase